MSALPDRRSVALLILAAITLRRVLGRLSEAQQRARIQRNAKAKGYSVGIIGAGVGGIQMAKKCIDLGLPFHIYECAWDYGGTWLYNNYPGSGCDVASHAYSFSWALNPEWTRKWSGRDEILEYFRNVARTNLKLEPHTSFNTLVKSATFENGEWTVVLEDVKTKAVFERKHTFLVSSVGQLNIPGYPDNIEKTMHRFKGVQFHSARWPEKFDLKGKRVACIGSGASAIQFAPEVAKQCGSLVVFQRTPGWIIHKADFEYPWWAKALFRIPLFNLIYRYTLFSMGELLIYATVIRNSGVNGPSKLNQISQESVKQEMFQYAPKALYDDILPKDRIGCKRILQSDGWFQMFHKDNVKLVTHAVQEVTETGLVDSTGQSHEFDVIIYGTGFETGSFLKGIDIKFRDKNGQLKDMKEDVWKGYPRAYNGVTVGGVPNFAMTYGPNHNVNHTSIISITESESEHIAKLFKKVASNGLASYTCKPEAWEKYNEREQELLKTTAFSAECNSWYTRNALHKILNNWHGSLVEMWLTTPYVKEEDYVFE